MAGNTKHVNEATESSRSCFDFVCVWLPPRNLFPYVTEILEEIFFNLNDKRLKFADKTGKQR